MYMWELVLGVLNNLLVFCFDIFKKNKFSLDDLIILFYV